MFVIIIRTVHKYGAACSGGVFPHAHHPSLTTQVSVRSTRLSHFLMEFRIHSGTTVQRTRQQAVHRLYPHLFYFQNVTGPCSTRVNLIPVTVVRKACPNCGVSRDSAAERHHVQTPYTESETHRTKHVECHHHHLALQPFVSLGLLRYSPPLVCILSFPSPSFNPHLS